MIREHFFEDQASWLAAATSFCLESLTHEQQNSAKKPLVYLSGGSTPKPLYEAMAQSVLPFTDIDWAMVDERWVESTHARSNEAFLQQCFAGADGFKLVGMKNAALTPRAGLTETEAAYEQLPGKATLCVLGMGGDGHTASLFPNAQGLDEALTLKAPNKLAAITAIQSEVTGSEIERLTLTLKTILDSKRVLLLIQGEDKLKQYQAARKVGLSTDLPVSYVLNQSLTTVEVFWCP